MNKFSAGLRQHEHALALREIGRERTLFIIDCSAEFLAHMLLTGEYKWTSQRHAALLCDPASNGIYPHNAKILRSNVSLSGAVGINRCQLIQGDLIGKNAAAGAVTPRRRPLAGRHPPVPPGSAVRRWRGRSAAKAPFASRPQAGARAPRAGFPRRSHPTG